MAYKLILPHKQNKATAWTRTSQRAGVFPSCNQKSRRYPSDTAGKTYFTVQNKHKTHNDDPTREEGGQTQTGASVANAGSLKGAGGG
jgi:hypothetical protein